MWLCTKKCETVVQIPAPLGYRLFKQLMTEDGASSLALKGNRCTDTTDFAPLSLFHLSGLPHLGVQ